jgi:hypothetical protein
MNADPNVREAETLAIQIAPLLANHHPAIISAALADATAALIISHRADMREEILAGHVELIGKLIGIYARLSEEDGHDVD